MSVDPFEIPAAAWRRSFDEILQSYGHPGRPKQLSILLKLLPIVLRLRSYTEWHRKAGLDPVDVLNPPQPGPYQGVPLGGIGGGSIGRGWRGDFRRWQLRPGNYSHRVVWADQFSLWVQRPEEAPRAQVLFPGSPPDNSLSAWQWNLAPQGASYRALFPRAWSLYEQPLPGIRLTCRQVSPVIPHNYQESSYPCAEFRWKVENTAAQDGHVSLMFSFQNSAGTLNDVAGGHSNHHFSQE